MMSYWLLSKVEAQNWKRYLEGKLSTALTTGSLIGLWLTSFLAVYREGAETVLFYYALVGDAKKCGQFHLPFRRYHCRRNYSHHLLLRDALYGGEITA